MAAKNLILRKWNILLKTAFWKGKDAWKYFSQMKPRMFIVCILKKEVSIWNIMFLQKRSILGERKISFFPYVRESSWKSNEIRNRRKRCGSIMQIERRFGIGTNEGGSVVNSRSTLNYKLITRWYFCIVRFRCYSQTNVNFSCTNTSETKIMRA